MDFKVQTIYDYRNFMSGSTEDYIRRDYSYDILGRLIQAEYYDSSQPEAAYD